MATLKLTLQESPKFRRWILIWLAGICALVGLTVIVGGATRLTNSGLSITEWRPLIGAIPPLNESEWNRLFELYKQIPEYSIEHPEMDLSGFKFIFFWEYLHRNLGRLIGLIFVFPFLFFWIRGALTPSFRNKLLIGFGLGALQGAMGWFMVMSGLTERTDVSHYRLAAHLLLAFFIFSYFLNLYLETSRPTPSHSRPIPKLRFWTNILLTALGLQIVYGAFVAGLKAGYAYNTYPKMYGRWIPEEAFSLAPLWLNAFENIALVQFIHRWLGALVVLLSAGLFILFRKYAASSELRQSLRFFFMALVTQFALGVMTLLSHMNMALALLHQLGALVVLGLLIRLRKAC